MAITRRDFLKGAVAAAAAGAALPAAAGTTSSTTAERRTFLVEGLDPAHDGLKLVQLSDLHVGPRTPPERIREAIARANAFLPDLVVLTGDYLSRDTRGVGLIREQLGGLVAPTLAVLGNHDHWVDPRGASRSLRALGYAVLRNENTTLQLRGAPFTVIGIDDRLSGEARPREALRGAPAVGSRLVLAHGPRTADDLRGAGQPLLCLSGHTHGGQVHIPGLTSFVLRAVAHEPYERGLYRLGAVQLYVNRGVGNSALRVRVNSDPEVTLAVLRPAPPRA
jgi:predicted MPP superfamily phosphohydrolase